MTLPLGIDISKHQGAGLNYNLMRLMTAFVAIRSGVSWGYQDPQFDANWQGMQGHNRIAYHVVYPSQSASRQMDWLLSIVDPGENDRLALDMELAQGLSKNAITDNFLTAIEWLRTRTGRYPITYSRANWVNSYLDINRLPKLNWWLANYLAPLPSPQFTPEKTPPPFMPDGVNEWLIHQTAEHGNGASVGVNSYYVDLDRWNGTIADVDAYFGRGEQPLPDPIPDPEPLFQARVYSWATPYVNVRAQPSTSSGKVGIKRPLDVVDVYETLKDWYRIEEGYIMSRFLERLDKQEPPSLMAVPLYSQRDPRWASDLMGASGITLGAEGCLVTCTAAGLTYLGYAIDPKEYNRLASTRGGYAPPNKMYWMFPDVITNNVIKRNEYRWVSGGVGWEQYVDPILDDKRPVWAEVRSNGRQHWVLIIGKVDGAYWILNPWHGDVVEMSTRYDRVYRIVSYQRRA
jgi:GH25 family lysozyme M1 (1,4-beta-N-acetylmuramidase)